MDNSPDSVDNLGTLWTRTGVSSRDARKMSPARANLFDVNEHNEGDGELLAAGEVCSLLHLARSTLPLWRARGDLVAYKMRNGHWRYPSNQPTLREARAVLDAQRVTP